MLEVAMQTPAFRLFYSDGRKMWAFYLILLHQRKEIKGGWNGKAKLKGVAPLGVSVLLDALSVVLGKTGET